jgi:hypothetical protein
MAAQGTKVGSLAAEEDSLAVTEDSPVVEEDNQVVEEHLYTMEDSPVVDQTNLVSFDLETDLEAFSQVASSLAVYLAAACPEEHQESFVLVDHTLVNPLEVLDSD